jgi:hypothetical protein
MRKSRTYGTKNVPAPMFPVRQVTFMQAPKFDAGPVTKSLQEWYSDQMFIRIRVS